MEKEKTIYDLELHECIYIGKAFNESRMMVMRVHDGWIYKSTGSSTFVPYNLVSETLSVDIPSGWQELRGFNHPKTNEKKTD